MVRLPKVLEFEWDAGNIDKSYQKHDITPREAEEVFVSEELYVAKDIKHAEKERRFIAFGRTQTGINLFIVFTMRRNKIRIISARKMHKKEADKYEKAKKNTQI